MSIGTVSISNEFATQVQMTIQKNLASHRPFFILVIRILNFEAFKKTRPLDVSRSLLQNVYNMVRRAVHTSQYVGMTPDGVGIVFDAVDAGQVDSIAQKLGLLVQNVIRQGKYNDLSGRWTDIIYQFLHPAGGAVLMTKVGWAISPRDGDSAAQLIKRALCHIDELCR